MSAALDEAIANTRAHLLSLRNLAGHWEGALASSALSTATAVVALHEVNALEHGPWITKGANWLIEHQNRDGGWGDTALSKSNLSTTLLCWGALRLAGPRNLKAEEWIRAQVGSLEAHAIASAVIARYGKDKTFSVPILMHCSICGVLGNDPWRRVLPLPFELAALPREWFGAIGLPVVSYALPALIAIGHCRYYHAPPPWWHPTRWWRGALWTRISPMLASLQPSSGGYLEATPLTSFVTMALASAGEKFHPCVSPAVSFLKRSMRPDGSWPIDTNLATWGTTLAAKALGASEACESAMSWVAAQQYRSVHPFTNAAPGGWAWTDLPGGVPDADDTAGALIALKESAALTIEAAKAGVTWLLELQNRDGGVPTFCRGWGALPFDRSTPELTAHALLAWALWRDLMDPETQARIDQAQAHGLSFLQRARRSDGSWIPLWFGNEHTHDEQNPVYGTAQVVAYLCGESRLRHNAEVLIRDGLTFLLNSQKSDGGWGGDASAPASIEETAVALHAVACAGAMAAPNKKHEIMHAAEWLVAATRGGTHFPAAPIGLYFARLWYHERLYPVIWTLQALRRAKAVLSSVTASSTTAPTTVIS